MNKEQIENIFIENIKDSYTLNLAMDILQENYQLEEQLEIGKEQYNDLVEEKEELKELYDTSILENQKYKEVIGKVLEYIKAQDNFVDYKDYNNKPLQELYDIIEILKEVE